MTTCEKTYCEKTYYENGNVEYEGWFLNGNIHRTDGPAYIQYFKSGNIKYEEWLVNGKAHRTDGPAVIEYYENGDIETESWYINGTKIDMTPFMHFFKEGTWEFKSKENNVAFILVVS